jgi:hypothetical protein
LAPSGVCDLGGSTALSARLDKNLGHTYGEQPNMGLRVVGREPRGFADMRLLLVEMSETILGKPDKGVRRGKISIERQRSLALFNAVGRPI